MSGIPTPEEKVKKHVFLRSYVVEGNPRLYDIAGFFRPISIKDQMIRACLLIERLVEEEIAQSGDKILIVGAGLAGMTAAVKAKKAGLKPTLIEKNLKPGGVLANSNRVVDFIQYDWVSSHWNDAQFPPKCFAASKCNNPMECSYPDSCKYPSTKIPFLLSASSPFDAVQDLREKLSTENIKPYLETELKGAKKVGDKIEVELYTKTYPNPEDDFVTIKDEFDLVISCAGFSAERVWLEGAEFTGLTFWELSYHEAFKSLNTSVLIGGGGDGAIQDFLVFATEAPTAKVLYEKLEIPDDLKNKIENRIGIAEDKVKRFEILVSADSKSYKKETCELFEDLEEVHRQQARLVLQDATVKENLKSQLSDIFRSGELQITIGCSHLTTCYPLNRFLLVLLSEYLDENLREKIFLKNWRVANIESADGRHVCARDAIECSGYRHKVTFNHQCVGCITATDNNCGCSDLKNPPDSYDLVIARFGIKSPRKIFNNSPALPGMQMPPYTI